MDRGAPNLEDDRRFSASSLSARKLPVSLCRRLLALFVQKTIDIRIYIRYEVEYLES
jgi:hypothetical protein